MAAPTKIILIVASVLMLAVVALAAYRGRYAMRTAQAFEVPAGTSAPRVLIATQGSAFKDALVQKLVEHLRSAGAGVSVVDVARLSGASPSEWAAVVVIHTWEMNRPPAPVEAFLRRAGGSPNIVVLTTSGSGDARIAGVDVISAASRMDDVADRAATLAARIDAVLARPNP
jgi:hypothetical protein